MDNTYNIPGTQHLVNMNGLLKLVIDSSLARLALHGESVQQMEDFSVISFSYFFPFSSRVISRFLFTTVASLETQVPPFVRTRQEVLAVVAHVPLQAGAGSSDGQSGPGPQLLHVTLGLGHGAPQGPSPPTLRVHVPPEGGERPPGERQHAHAAKVLQQVSGNRRVAQVLALKEHVDFPEGRAVGVGALPALAHQVVDLLGAVGGLRQQGLAVGKMQQVTLGKFLIAKLTKELYQLHKKCLDIKIILIGTRKETFI